MTGGLFGTDEPRRPWTESAAERARRDAEDARKLARRDDLGTSKAAAERAASRGVKSEHDRRILRALEALGSAGGTKNEIAERAGLDDVAVARRMSTLRDRGAVVATGQTRATPSGAAATVWTLNPDPAAPCPTSTTPTTISVRLSLEELEALLGPPPLTESAAGAALERARAKLRRASARLSRVPGGRSCSSSRSS